MDITYTLTLTVTRAIESWQGDDTPQELEDCADWMVSAPAYRELEKDVLKALRTFDGECDVEVMDAERVESKAGKR